MTRLQLVAAAALAGMIVLAGCDPNAESPGDTPQPAGKLSVVTTTTQIRSMAESVAGNMADVRSILPPGSDPHDFEPKPSDVAAISGSAVVLKNGLGLDDWVDRIIKNAGGERPIVTVSKGVAARKGDEEDPNGDPHIWFSVPNAMTMTLNIRDALMQVDRTHAGTYRANADAYLATLSQLDKYIMEQVATIPPDQRKIVTSHDDLGYFIDRYGLTFAGSIVESMSTSAQPTAQDIARLIEGIKSEKVKAIFVEKSVNPRLAQQIAGDTGVKVVDSLYGDALGAPGTPGATYEGMMRYDTDTIVAALK